MYELVNTSVPNGLIAGTRGFATVAMTKGMPDAIRSRVEGLCAYPHRTSAHDASYWQENPVNWFHLTLPNGDHVVGRTAPADFDYTGRTNRLSRTLCFPSREMPLAGGAFVLLSAESRFCAPWSGEPRFLPKDDLLYGQLGLASRPASNPRHWIEFFGERGEDYARRFAQLVANNVSDGNRSVPFKVSTACDRDGKLLLGLFFDLINLLPDAVASQVTFSTFSACVPGGSSCHLRGVFDSDRAFDAASVSQPWVDCENRRVMHEELLPPPLRAAENKPTVPEPMVGASRPDLHVSCPTSSQKPQGSVTYPNLARQSVSSGPSWTKIIVFSALGLFAAGFVLWGFYQLTKVGPTIPSEVNVDTLIKSIGETNEIVSSQLTLTTDSEKSASDTEKKLDESKTNKVTVVKDQSRQKKNEEEKEQQTAAKRQKEELKARQEIREREKKVNAEDAKKKAVADAKRNQIEKMALSRLDVTKMFVEKRKGSLDKAYVDKIIEKTSGIKKEGAKINAFGGSRNLSKAKQDTPVKSPIVDAIVVWMWNGKTLQHKVHLLEEKAETKGKTPMDVALSDIQYKFPADLKWVVYWFVDSKIKDEKEKGIATVGVYWQLKNEGKVISREPLFKGGNDWVDLVARALGEEGAALWRKKFRKAVFLVRWGKHGVYVENALSFTDITKKMTSKINGEIKRQEDAKNSLVKEWDYGEMHIEKHIVEYKELNKKKSQLSNLTGTDKLKGKTKPGGKKPTKWKEEKENVAEQKKNADDRQNKILKMYKVNDLASLEYKKNQLDNYKEKITELNTKLAGISENCREAKFEAILCDKDPAHPLDEVFELDEKNQTTEQGWK